MAIKKSEPRVIMFLTANNGEPRYFNKRDVTGSTWDTHNIGFAAKFGEGWPVTNMETARQIMNQLNENRAGQHYFIQPVGVATKRNGKNAALLTTAGDYWEWLPDMSFTKNGMPAKAPARVTNKLAMAHLFKSDPIKGSKTMTRNANPTSAPFNVYLHGKKIDTVFYDPRTFSADEIRQSLVNHDGYDSDIEVRKGRATTRKANPREGADTEAARELYFYAINTSSTSDLLNATKHAVARTATRKGGYDGMEAIKSWVRAAKSMGARYSDDYGPIKFSGATLNVTARMLENHTRDDVKALMGRAKNPALKAGTKQSKSYFAKDMNGNIVTNITKFDGEWISAYSTGRVSRFNSLADAKDDAKKIAPGVQFFTVATRDEKGYHAPRKVNPLVKGEHYHVVAVKGGKVAAHWTGTEFDTNKAKAKSYMTKAGATNAANAMAGKLAAGYQVGVQTIVEKGGRVTRPKK